MNNTTVPQWFTAQQLVGLPGMPTTDRGIRKQNQKNLLVYRSKLRGKGLEYALTSLPAETQAYLVAQYTKDVLQALPAPITAPVPAVVRPAGQHLRRAVVPAVVGGDVVFDGSSAADRAMAVARKVVVRKIEDLVEKMTG